MFLYNLSALLSIILRAERNMRPLSRGNLKTNCDVWHRPNTYCCIWFFFNTFKIGETSSFSNSLHWPKGEYSNGPWLDDCSLLHQLYKLLNPCTESKLISSHVSILTDWQCLLERALERTLRPYLDLVAQSVRLCNACHRAGMEAEYHTHHVLSILMPTRGSF